MKTERLRLSLGLLAIAFLGTVWNYAYSQQSIPARWKTYHNEQHGFVFRYPDNWGVREQEGEGGWLVTVASKGELYAFTVRVVRPEPDPLMFQSPFKQNVRVGGGMHRAYVFPRGRGCPEEPGGCAMFYIPVRHGGTWYVLEGKRGIEGGKLSERSSYPHILLSWKFSKP